MLRPDDIAALDTAWIRWVCEHVLKGTGVKLVSVEPVQIVSYPRIDYGVIMSYCGWSVRYAICGYDEINTNHIITYARAMVRELYENSLKLAEAMQASITEKSGRSK